MTTSANIAKAIAVTAELTGTELTAPVLKAMVARLEHFTEHAVLVALDRCCTELTGRLTLAAIIERLTEADGRPSPDEAWAISLDARDESETVIWCTEMQEAFAVARPVLEAGDKIGARMAFRETYARLVKEARAAGRPAQWVPSLGFDEDRRRVVLQKAIDAGKLAHKAVEGLLPAPEGTTHVLLGNQTGTGPQHDEGGKAVELCKTMLATLADAEKARERRRIQETKAQSAEFERRRAASIAIASRSKNIPSEVKNDG